MTLLTFDERAPQVECARVTDRKDAFVGAEPTRARDLNITVSQSRRLANETVTSRVGRSI